MIRYSKKYWGLHVLFRMYGSAFPRALPFSLASAALAGFLAFFFPTSTTWDLFSHPYPFQTFAFIAGFMVVFRCALTTSCTPENPKDKCVATIARQDLRIALAVAAFCTTLSA